MFQLGQEVQYKDTKGFVDFIDEHYIGICVKEYQDRLRCVRVIVYPDCWEKIIINTNNV